MSALIVSALLQARRNSWTETGVSAAAAPKTISKAANPDYCHYVTGFEVALAGAAAGADIIIKLQADASGAPVTLWQTLIGASAVVGTRVNVVFPMAMRLPKGKSADLVVSAGGSGCMTNLNLAGFTAN